MLARRPAAPGVAAFGHLDLNPSARSRLGDLVSKQFVIATEKEEVDFHPDDLPDDNEVLVADLRGFDSWFQAQAPWSLERAIREMRRAQLPPVLTASGVAGGDWGFYLVRSRVKGSDVVVVRARSPTWGLKREHKLIAAIVGDELRPVDEPLLSFDHAADLVVIDDAVYVFEPRKIERLLIDAQAVKDRAPEIAASLELKLPARMAPETITAIEAACSHNANIARRVERIVRDQGLSGVTASRIRDALPDAGFSRSAFGASGPLRVRSPRHATVLIDIIADLYYQPRFTNAPRRVAAYRLVR